MATPEELRLLMEIKGDLGETYGLVSAVRDEVAAHRVEDREQHQATTERMSAIERHQAELAGHARARERGEIRQAGIVAALISGAISLLGAFFPHWWNR
jgi:hypothetical protein